MSNSYSVSYQTLYTLLSDAYFIPYPALTP
jgi:hypothetical protein